jgi:hypothetical protein
LEAENSPRRHRGWRRASAHGIGGLSWWFILAVASLLLVFPTGLSLLFSASTTTRNGLVYATEAAGGGAPRFVSAPWGRCIRPLPLKTTFDGIEFAASIEGPYYADPPATCAANESVVGNVTEADGRSYTFNVSWTSAFSTPWMSPDGLVGIGLQENPGAYLLMVSVTVIPGAPTYFGPALFATGAIGLVACAAFLVGRFVRRKGGP